MTGQAGGGFALGVDLGTSNTVAVLRWPDGRTRPLLFDGQPIMPSGAYLDPTGLLHAGRDASRLAHADPGRYEPNPKRRVDEPAVLLGDREVATADLLAAALRAVARAAVEAVGFLPPAAVTYPASWGARRREVLAAAIVRAGWPPADATGAGSGTLLLPEPVAAARYFVEVLRRPVPVGSAVTVFDFGAGTLDIAVVRNAGRTGPDTGRDRFVVIGSGGVAELGGLDLDAALVEHLGRLLGTSAPQVWERLANPRTPAQWRSRRQFWDDVRGAKEMLSRAATAPVPVPGLDQAVHVTREELEGLAAPLLRRGVHEVARVLADSGVRPDQVAGLFLVGGSSRVPLVARLLHGELGLAPTVLEQPELPVAEGALTELAGLAGSPTAESGTVESGAAESPGAAPPAPAYPGTVPPVPARSSARRRTLAWLAAGVALLLVIVSGGLGYYYLTRGPAPLEFTDVSQVARFRTGDERPYYAFTSVAADRAFLAWLDGNRLEVIGADARTGEEHWRHTMSGRFEQWAWIQGYPEVLLVAAYVPGAAEPRPIYALDPATGAERWRYDFHGNDVIWVFDEMVVLADNEADRLVGLDPKTGERRWTLDNPRNEYDYTDAEVYSARTEEDLDGPAAADGRALALVPDDDYRLVQIGSDRRARVIDARSGKVLTERGNVGELTDKYLVYDGRLFVVGSGGGYQVVAYDLAKLGEPRSIYRAPDERRSLLQIQPCGPDRVCLLDSRSAEAESVEVAAVDAAGGGQLWREPEPGADVLVGVGDRVLVARSSGEAAWALRDDRGGELIRREGTAVRLDAGNVLSFVGSFSTVSSDLSVAGVGAGSGAATELGPLPQARGETCSWSTARIACMAETEFVLWSFTEN